MNSRERFHATMTFGRPDHVPHFEEGIRDEVLAAWRSQGLTSEDELSRLISIDRREEVELDVEPHPEFLRWPSSRAGLQGLRRRLDADDPSRLPAGWPGCLQAWRQRDHVLLLRLHRGLFLTMGVGGWRRFARLMELLVDDPGFVRDVMQIQAEFVARLAERILREIQVDAVLFSEPIGGNHGSLISPRMYEEFALRSYQPVLDTVRRFGIDVIIIRTYANARVLVPGMLKYGFNCLWACETDPRAMDYQTIRREFGGDLRLIAGIDLDTLRIGKEAIRTEMQAKVPPLLEEGGYIPLADGRVRDDITLENYLYYRHMLEEMTQR